MKGWRWLVGAGVAVLLGAAGVAAFGGPRIGAARAPAAAAGYAYGPGMMYGYPNGYGPGMMGGYGGNGGYGGYGPGMMWGWGASGSNPPPPTVTAGGMQIPQAENTKSIAVSAGTITPVVAVVHVGDQVTWTNQGSSAQTLVSYPGAPAPLSVTVPAQGSTAFSFTAPGIYRYYGQGVATYSAKMDDVQADPSAPAFPTPLRGAVVVLDANGSLPSSATATIDIPDSTMAFTPWALVVPAGTRVTWTNHDGDPHVVAAVPGYAAAALAPAWLPGGGGTASQVLSTPGVYYYYCPLHAAWDASSGQMLPLKAYGMYPFVMDGLIVVTPNS